MSIPGALTAGLNYYRANTKGNYGKDVIKAYFGFKKFKRIKIPTLLILALNDIALERALTYDMDEFFEGKFDIRYIENCSHWVHIESQRSDPVC